MPSSPEAEEEGVVGPEEGEELSCGGELDLL
jgi:hypothetical protein